MSTLISIASGNFTAAATWAVVDPTSALDSETNSTASTTSFVYSQTFVPGAITIDGIAIKMANVNVAQTGTFSVELFNNTLASTVTTVTINVNDLPNFQGNLGWHFFKFSSPQTLIILNAYKIGIKSSTNAQVTVFRDATAGNWSRLLRTTTTAAPAADDTLRMMGEHTGAGTKVPFTITMDNTTTTSFGNVAATAGMSVSDGATFTFGTAASTNYYLKWKGAFQLRPGGVMNVGTSGTPIPSTSSVVLEMDSQVNVDTGLNINPLSTFNAYGATKATVNTLLTADKAAAATVLQVASTSGWAAGDTLVIASTTRTASESESKVILTVDSPTQVTLTSGLTNAHSGTSPTQAEVINLDRNVKIRGISTSLQGYFFCDTTAVANLQYVEFYQLGSATANKRGLDIGTTTGTFNLSFSSLHDFIVASSLGILAVKTATANNQTFANNVLYNINNAAVRFNVASTGTNINFTGNIAIKNTANFLYFFSDIGGNISNNIAVSGIGGGFTLDEGGGATIGTFSGNLAHSNTTVGFDVGSSPYSTNGTMLNCTSWRNTTFGITLNSIADLILDGFTAFGNTTANIYTSTVGSSGKLQIDNSTINAGTTLTCPIGFQIEGGLGSCTMDSTTFGGTTTHSTGDIQIKTQMTTANIIMNNCLLNSTNQLVNQTNLTNSSRIGSSKHNQTNGSHRTFKKYGTISIDTIIFDVTPSQRLTPINVSNKLESGHVRIPVLSGQTLTPSIKVRKSVVGDGSAYNGNQARLILKKNVSAGISADTVIATSTNAANGAFETISGTTISVTDDAVLTFVVDCDGTAGWVNIDSWSVT